MLIVWLQGSWVRGKRQGLGKQNYLKGDIYEGLWKEDLQEGPGRCVCVCVCGWSNSVLFNLVCICMSAVKIVNLNSASKHALEKSTCMHEGT